MKICIFKEEYSHARNEFDPVPSKKRYKNSNGYLVTKQSIIYRTIFKSRKMVQCML